MSMEGIMSSIRRLGNMSGNYSLVAAVYMHTTGLQKLRALEHMLPTSLLGWILLSVAPVSSYLTGVKNAGGSETDKLPTCMLHLIHVSVG